MVSGCWGVPVSGGPGVRVLGCAGVRRPWCQGVGVPQCPPVTALRHPDVMASPRTPQQPRGAQVGRCRDAAVPDGTVPSVPVLWCPWHQGVAVAWYPVRRSLVSRCCATAPEAVVPGVMVSRCRSTRDDGPRRDSDKRHGVVTPRYPRCRCQVSRCCSATVPSTMVPGVMVTSVTVLQCRGTSSASDKRHGVVTLWYLVRWSLT